MALSPEFDTKPRIHQGSELTLSRNQVRKLKKLTGWQNRYRIPDKLSSSADIFLAEVCLPDLRLEIDAMYQTIRENLQLKRKQIVSSVSMEGSAAISTPYFTYSVSTLFNKNNLSETLWVRKIDQISSFDKIAQYTFCDTFDDFFDTISLTLPKHASVSDFIDQVESADIPSLTLKYDEECRFCDLILAGKEAFQIRVTCEALSITHDSASRISTLLDSFETIQSLMFRHKLTLPSPNQLD